MEYRNQIVNSDALSYLRTLPDNSVNCIVSSPPYYALRDYGVEGQLGLEPTPAEYVANMVAVFREAKRALRDDGVCFVNLGDTYVGGGRGTSDHHRQKIGAKTANAQALGRLDVDGFLPKTMMGIPWRFALAMMDDGWILRNDIIWAKRNPMPESVTDRFTSSHEHVFMFTKSSDTTFWVHRDHEGSRTRPAPDYRWVHKDTGEEVAEEPADWRASGLWSRINLWTGRDYWADLYAVREEATYAGKVVTLGEKSLSKGQATGANVKASGNALKDSVTVGSHRNARDVWSLSSEPFAGAHFAVMPSKLVEKCLLVGCPETVCAVCGAPWTRVVERSGGTTGQSWHDHANDLEQGMLQVTNMPGGLAKARSDHGEPYTVTDHGFRPTCTCDQGTVRGVVCDPFMGSGTVARTAIRLRRDFCGCDLNPEYVRMATDSLDNLAVTLFTL